MWIYFFTLSLFSITIFTQDKLKKYTLKEFVNAPDQELVKHKKTLDSVSKEKRGTIPQSQAILFYPDPVEHKKRLIDDTLKYQHRHLTHRAMNEKDYAMFDKVLKSEEDAHAKGHMVLNHSANESYGKMYVNDRLQRLALELQGIPVRHSKNFLFRNISARTNINAEKQKRKTFLKQGVTRSDWDDKADLLSCNLGVTGNSIKADESSLNYYLIGENRRIKSEVPLIPCIADEAISKPVIDELSGAIKKFEEKNQRGVWMQIILKNKKDARKILYNSWDFGMRRVPIVGGKKVDNPVQLIQAMHTTPEQIEDLGRQQTRIVLTTDKFLDLTNPNIEVKAFSPDEENLNEFHNTVELAIDGLRTQHLNEWRALTLSQKLKRYIMNIPKKQIGQWQKKQIKKDSKHWFIAQ